MRLTTSQIVMICCAIAVLAAVGASYAVQQARTPEIESIRIMPIVFSKSISVSGTVTPTREIQLGFTTGGRVSSVNGGVGSTISAGSVIASIDAEDIRASIMQREAALDNQIARLESVRTGARREEIDVAQAAVDGAETALVQSGAGIVDVLRDAYVKADDAVRVQIAQFLSGAKTANPKLTFDTSNSQLASDMLSSFVAVEAMLTSWQSEVGALTTQADASAAVLKAQSNITQVSGLLAKVSAVIASGIPGGVISQQMLDSFAADIAGARSQMSGSTNAIQTAVTAQKNAKAALETARKNLVLTQAAPSDADIAAQSAQVRSAEADLANARAQLAKTMIVAPFTGVLTTVDAKVGLIASPNTPLITMIRDGAFQVESYVPEVNVGRVAPGNRAVVTLDAYGNDVTFDASVVSIDPAAVVRDGVPTYRAVLQFMQPDQRIKPGMTANILITTEERDGVIAVPQGVIDERDGKNYIRVLVGSVIMEREVRTGAVSSLGQTEILEGLTAGETVVTSMSTD